MTGSSSTHVEDGAAPQVAVFGRGAADVEGLVGEAHVLSVPVEAVMSVEDVECNLSSLQKGRFFSSAPVCIRVDGDRGDAEALGSGQHAARDLAAVGDH